MRYRTCYSAAEPEFFKIWEKWLLGHMDLQLTRIIALIDSRGDSARCDRERANRSWNRREMDGASQSCLPLGAV